MEYFFTCPYCWRRISMVLEELDEVQSYIEDCEVCCKPIELHYVVRGETVLEFHARRL